MAYIESPTTGDRQEIGSQKASRVEIYGDTDTKKSVVTNADPDTDDYALVVRPIIGSQGFLNKGISTGGSSPSPTDHPPKAFTDYKNSTSLSIDDSGNLRTRGPNFTDEGSFRDDFSGTSLSSNLSGICTFTNNSTVVTGSSTNFLSEITTDHYLQLTGHSESTWVKVLQVNSNTELVLKYPYSGSSGGGVGKKSFWATTTANGGSLAVSSSSVQLSSGMNNSGKSILEKAVDFLPIALASDLYISQRISNQTALIGLIDNPTLPSQRAYFLFDGTDNTIVKTVTSFSNEASEIETTTAKLPLNITSSTKACYKIEVQGQSVIFSVNDSILSIHKAHIPSPYTILSACYIIENSANVTNGTLYVDTVYINNLNQLEVASKFKGSPITTRIITEEPLLAPTYSVTIRSAPKAMASGTWQFLALWHTSTSLQNIYIKGVSYTIESCSNNSIVKVNFVRLTTPILPSGGVSIVPIAFDPSESPSESIAMQLPTTNGSEVSTSLATHSFSLGSTAGLTTPSTSSPNILYTSKNLSTCKAPKARAGFPEGYAISITASTNITLVVSATIEFTEELDFSSR